MREIQQSAWQCANTLTYIFIRFDPISAQPVQQALLCWGLPAAAQYSTPVGPVCPIGPSVFCSHIDLWKWKSTLTQAVSRISKEPNRLNGHTVKQLWCCRLELIRIAFHYLPEPQGNRNALREEIMNMSPPSTHYWVLWKVAIQQTRFMTKLMGQESLFVLSGVHINNSATKKHMWAY